MEKQLNQILKEQIIEEAHQRKLDDLIVFFMVRYPNFPYVELDLEHLTSDYLKIYDISFLASYIRYSDLDLLKSGMQDEEVRKKLCYLYHHIGTIKKSYRNFIWSNDITLEDLNRWLPLLCNIRLKNRIMENPKVTKQYKDFLDLCCNENTFSYQCLILLDSYYSEPFDMNALIHVSNKEAFYKLVKIVVENHIAISYHDLIKNFSKIQDLLEKTSISVLSQYHFWLEEYLKNCHNFLALHSFKELDNFCQFRTNFHRFFLIDEYQISSLKEFYCKLFLGLSYQEFESTFIKIPNDQSKAYQLLQELYQAQFPLSLKENLYQKFLECENLKIYFEKERLKIEKKEMLKLNSASTFIEKERPIITFQNSSFSFVTSSIDDYLNFNDTLIATIESNQSFHYQEECLLAYSNVNPLFYEQNTCTLKKQDLRPEFLVAYDIVSLKHLKYQKLLGLPIVIIDTELYAEKLMQQLNKMYADRNWKSYSAQKQTLFFALQSHPWLFTKYFKIEFLYQDVEVWMKKLEDWMREKVPSTFLKKQFMILEQLISLNEKLEVILTDEKNGSFQYRKKMLQYKSITEQ